MAISDESRTALLNALDAAFADDWAKVHHIVQNLEDEPVANWLHALHHKREGDAENARYWYARSPMDYDRFPDPKVELRAILHELTQER